MRIKGLNFLFVLYAFSAFLLASYTIVFHIKFIFLPVLFFCFGFLSELFLKKKGVLVFLFLLPLVNSLPGFFYNGYSFNLMGISLFYLSGIILSSIIKEKRFPDFSKYLWGGFYIWFLSIMWISAIFIFFKWSNITLSFNVFWADTPVAPGFPSVSRNSFASLFPVITLFLFSVPPFIAPLLKKIEFSEEKIFKIIIAGFTLSFFIAIYQKFFDPGFMALRWWGEKLNRYNGGFSDFNGFGFFAGALFLYSLQKMSGYASSGENFKRLFNREPAFYLFSSHITFFAVVLSGSRTAFIFVLSAFLFFFINKKIQMKKKVIIIVILIFMLLISGGTLKKRLAVSVEKFKDTFSSNDLITSLDKVSNNRIRMIIDSIPIFTNYPVSGIGTGNFIFYLKYLKYKEKYLEDLPLNQYLLILNELGLPGLILFFLFLWSLLYGRKKNTTFLVLLIILIVLLVGNSFWLPEIMIFFWIFTAYLERKQKISFSGFKGSKVLFVIILSAFIIYNILNFTSLHPKALMSRKGLSYDYGFWEENVKSDFRWTGNRSGIYLKLNENGESDELKIFCGAPVAKLDGKLQRVMIYWKNDLFRKIDFRKNREFVFRIKDKPLSSGFLRFEVFPTFNLKKLGIGNESRDLGIQFFPGLN
ncbi:MAG: O-antigen ligase family protein [Acidobacteriota bacterium]